MGSDENYGSFRPSENDWKGRKRRDDTPSFIRTAAQRAQMLNPQRSGEHIPVLTMPPSVRIWRKVRWPLLVGVVLILLVVVGVFTNNILVAGSVERKVEEAREAEVLATVDGLRLNQDVLAALADRNPGRINAQESFAWNSVLVSELHGDREKALADASAAFDRISSDPAPMALAALAGRKYLQGDLDGAMKDTLAGLEKHPKEPRLQLVRSWILAANGETDEALELLSVLRTGKPEYLPALHTALFISLDSRRMTDAGKYAHELLTLSPGSLLGSLGSVAVRLPSWNGDEPSAEEIVALVKDMNTLSRVLSAAPPRLEIIGRYMSGRVNLLALNLEAAAKDLKYVSSNGGMVDAVAWYGMAVRSLEGPRKALEVLQGADGEAGPELNSLRARCYLDGHRVQEAAQALDEIGDKADEMGAGELRWVLAVRNADLDSAKKLMPKVIGRRLMWVGVEMYHLLRRAGDAEGIETLTSRMAGGASGCVSGMNAWIGGSLSSVTETLTPSDDADVCTQSLAVSLMWGHLPPADLTRSAEKVAAASEGELFPQVDRALALWLTEGRDAASTALSTITEKGADGPMLRMAIARAYLTMDLANEAEGILDGIEHPEAAALWIEALTKLGKNKKADKALTAALQDEKAKDHPAVVMWSLTKKLQAGANEQVVDEANEILDRAGAWTAEIADLKARAQNAMGSRGDADRGLASVAKKVKKTVGFDEAWQTKLALIRLNLRRGGNFLFKAVGVTLEMYKAGVKDAELSYSYAVANIRQGNERGAVRYLREAVELDPSFVASYGQLKLLGKLPDDYIASLEKVRPGTVLE